MVGCDEHHKKAEMADDESITLVKDTQNIFPINPTNKKNLRLYFIECSCISFKWS